MILSSHLLKLCNYFLLLFFRGMLSLANVAYWGLRSHCQTPTMFRVPSVCLLRLHISGWCLRFSVHVGTHWNWKT